MHVYRLSVKRFLKFFESSLLKLFFPANSVLPHHFFLMPDVHELDGNSALLLGLPHQSVDQLLFSICLLRGKKTIKSNLQYKLLPSLLK